jgi:hypothetical protein
MSDNPFSNFNIDIPRKYSEKIKSYSATGGGSGSRELCPFERQVDFWYCAFLLAVNKELSPVIEKDTYNATGATILTTDPYRIIHIRATFLSISKDLAGLADNKKVFDFAMGMANAGIPLLIQILDDDEQKPIWNILDEIESRVG